MCAGAHTVRGARATASSLPLARPLPPPAAAAASSGAASGAGPPAACAQRERRRYGA